MLVANALTASAGCGREFRIQNPEDSNDIDLFLKHLPVNSPSNEHPGRKSFVYTNVKAQEGGEEGSAYHLNQEAIETFLGMSSAQNLLKHASDAAGLGKLDVDYKIDSIDYLRQTHSSWFDRHIDSHANGSLDFAVICLLSMEGLLDDAQVAVGCGVSLFPNADVHDESMNLVAGGSMGEPIKMAIQKPGDCAVFPGRWVYHQSVHSDVIGITGVLHKVVLFGYFVESVSVPVEPLYPWQPAASGVGKRKGGSLRTADSIYAKANASEIDYRLSQQIQVPRIATVAASQAAGGPAVDQQPNPAPRPEDPARVAGDSSSAVAVPEDGVGGIERGGSANLSPTGLAKPAQLLGAEAAQ